MKGRCDASDEDAASALGTAIWCAAAASCSRAPGGRLAVRPIYGPVIGIEVIAGRAEDLDARQPVVLLVGDSALVAIDLSARTVIADRWIFHQATSAGGWPGCATDRCGR